MYQNVFHQSKSLFKKTEVDELFLLLSMQILDQLLNKLLLFITFCKHYNLFFILLYILIW